MNREELLDLTVDDNTLGPMKLGDFLCKLVQTLREEGEGFSGKRPFGNSGWRHGVYAALVKAKVIDGKFDEDDYLTKYDREAGDRIIGDAIQQMWRSAP